MPRHISYIAQLGSVLRQRNPRALRMFLIDNAARYGDQRQVADLEAKSDAEMEELLHRMIVARSNCSRCIEPAANGSSGRASIPSVRTEAVATDAVRSCQPRMAFSGARIPSARTRPAQLSSSAEPSFDVLEDGDGSFRVEVTDEDGAMLPVVRQVSRAQADLLVERIKREARAERKPIKSVIRDPYFMAATVITIKRQQL